MNLETEKKMAEIPHIHPEKPFLEITGVGFLIKDDNKTTYLDISS